MSDTDITPDTTADPAEVEEASAEADAPEVEAAEPEAAEPLRLLPRSWRLTLPRLKPPIQPRSKRLPRRLTLPRLSRGVG